ncbi:MAG: hypothetical protein ABSA16_17205 [Thermoguttaceae bacterium]|jgi:hypothetical protein
MKIVPVKAKKAIAFGNAPVCAWARSLVKLDFCSFLPIIVHSLALAPEQGRRGIGFSNPAFFKKERE